jgi:hypothetical protein
MAKKPVGVLSKNAILGATDLPLERVEVPEWKGAVYLRVMTGAERDAFDAEVLTSPDRHVNARARLVIRVLVDENGARLFADEDAELLGAKSAAALGRLFDTACRLNGFGAEAGEELEKN